VKLPVVSGAQAVKAFAKMGYLVDRQRGSHIILREAGAPHRRLCIPNHPELAKGALRALIKEAGLSVDQFTRLL